MSRDSSPTTHMSLGAWSLSDFFPSKKAERLCKHEKEKYQIHLLKYVTTLHRGFRIFEYDLGSCVTAWHSWVLVDGRMALEHFVACRLPTLSTQLSFFYCVAKWNHQCHSNITSFLLLVISLSSEIWLPKEMWDSGLSYSKVSIQGKNLCLSPRKHWQPTELHRIIYQRVSKMMCRHSVPQFPVHLCACLISQVASILRYNQAHRF